MIGSIDREVPTPTEGVGSRFSQWFQPGSRGSTSRENSRRSSMNEDFSYLHGNERLFFFCLCISDIFRPVLRNIVFVISEINDIIDLCFRAVNKII